MTAFSVFRTFVFLCLIGLLSCTGDTGYDVRKVFHYNESNGITSLDPAFSRNLENMWACNQLFDGLVELDASMHIQPSIAREWSLSEDGRTYRFILRDDAYFHPDSLIGEKAGRRVEAADFVFSFQRLLDPKVASPGKWVFQRVDLEKNGGFEARGRDTLLIHLKEAFPPFLGILSMQYCNVVSPEAVKRYGADFRSHPIGTGPFRFAFWYEEVALVYHKNKSYWKKDVKGSSLPYLDAVKITFVKDMGAEFLGLVKGDYDFMSGIHPAYKDELLTNMGELSPAYSNQLTLQKTPFIKTDYIGILVDTSLQLMQGHPLLEKEVRQALNGAINRKEMVRYLRNNAVYPAERGFIPNGLPGFDQDSDYGITYDPERSRKLLQNAGYPGGEGLPELVISTTSDYVDLCEFIQHQWAGIGVELRIDILPGSTHREQVANSRVMMFRKSWLADYPDAENFLGLFYSENFCPSGPNYTHFSNSSFDQLFDRAAQKTIEEERYALYRSMDSIVVDQAPVIPLFYDQVTHFVRNDVQGWEVHPSNMLDLTSVYKD